MTDRTITEPAEGTEPSEPADAWGSTYFANTLFVDDLATAADFYRRAFGREPILETDDSVVFNVGGVLANLLAEQAVPELIDPAPVAPSDAGARAVYTVHVTDVDEVITFLTQARVELLNGPVDRWWGPRTASFADPSGHIWEISGPRSDADQS